MDISVIIPSYKPKEYIWECLDSLSGQTLPKDRYEVIIILNGCDSPWSDQIKEYIASRHLENDFIFIQTDEAGVSNARNIGLDHAMGEYITFVDDDDYVSENYLENLLALASKDTISLSYTLAFNDGQKNFSPIKSMTANLTLPHDKKFHFVKGRNYFGGPCRKLIHRDIIGTRRFDTNFSNGEDTIFMCLISDRFHNVSFADKSTIYFRRLREDSANFRLNSRQKASNSRRVVKALIKIYFSNPLHYNIIFFASKIWGIIHSSFNNAL